MGMMQKRRASQACCALRNIKLLVGIGCLEFQTGMAGMDPRTNMSSKSPFRSASHFANIGSCKAGSPTSNPLMLKAHSRQLVPHWFAATTTPWPNPLLLCIRQVFLQLQRRDGIFCNPNAELVERAAAVRKLLLPGSGCLEFLKGMAGMDFLSKHVQQISFQQCVSFCQHRPAARLAAPLPTHCC